MSSGTSFPRFDSEEIHNLPATEVFTGSVETAPAAETPVNTESLDVSVRQADASIAPSAVITPADISLRNLIPDELRRGGDRRT